MKGLNMAFITREITRFQVKAVRPVINEDGSAAVDVLYEGECLAASLSKNTARKFVMDELGERLPQGVSVVWKPISTEKYQMDLDEFIESAVCVSNVAADEDNE